MRIDFLNQSRSNNFTYVTIIITLLSLTYAQRDCMSWNDNKVRMIVTYSGIVNNIWNTRFYFAFSKKTSAVATLGLKEN